MTCLGMGQSLRVASLLFSCTSACGEVLRKGIWTERACLQMVATQSTDRELN